MKFIRIFLWFLVAAMTLQGYLHADEYGTAISLIGGISLSLSIWKERMASSIQSLWTTAPSYIPLPRAFVIAAIRETARHPGLHMLPSLRRALSEQRERVDAFRHVEIQWMLRHTDLVGAIATEGRYVWEHWATQKDIAFSIIAANTRLYCSFLPSTQCSIRAKQIEKAESLLANATKAIDVWGRVLHMDMTIDILHWWNGISASNYIDTDIHNYHITLRTLHDIHWPSDVRLRKLQDERIRIVEPIGDTWLRLLLKSLLERDMWYACLEHLKTKEMRLHTLMLTTDVHDMIIANEKMLNASLRASDTPQMIRDWFAEASGYAWWMGDDIPAIVHRCSRHTVGDCARIGPTEIVSLSTQYDERVRIIEDWTRRLFLGLWNALPALGLLFALELIVLIVPQRRIYVHIDGESILAKYNRP
jgi:hypothetical protein